MDSQLRGNTSHIDNSTKQIVDSELLVVVDQITGVVGFVAAFINGVVLFYISRLLMKKKNIFLIQLLFVSLIDGGGSLTTFIVSQLLVLDYTSLAACLVFSMCVLAFDCMSKGNILCICIQRLQFAKNIRKVASTWKLAHTASLITINIALGLFATLIALLDLPDLSFRKSFHYNPICSPFSLKIVSMYPVIIMFVVGFIFLLASNICCVLTIWKLVKGSNQVEAVNSDPSSGSDGAVYLPSKKRQWHAIITISGMLIMFTCSSVPLIIGTILKIVGVNVLPAELRLCLVAGYITVMFNPLLIIYRTQDIRNGIRENISGLFRKICGPANR